MPQPIRLNASPSHEKRSLAPPLPARWPQPVRPARLAPLSCDGSPPASRRSASVRPYQPPDPLLDLHVLDLLELSGSQLRAAEALMLHQSTVSRSLQRLTRQLRLERRHGTRSTRFISNTCLQHLRLAYRAHRLMEQHLRVATDALHQPLLPGLRGLLVVPPRFRSTGDWAELVLQGLLDGAIVSSIAQERSPLLETDTPPLPDGLAALPLGALRLQLVTQTAEADMVPERVLLPRRSVAPLLHQRVRELGLMVLSQPEAAQEPLAWLRRLRERRVALPLCPDLVGASWLAGMRLRPLEGELLRERLWLLLPADGLPESALVRSLVRRLRRRLALTGAAAEDGPDQR